jgi:hypothetical protein
VKGLFQIGCLLVLFGLFGVPLLVFLLMWVLSSLGINPG